MDFAAGWPLAAALLSRVEMPWASVAGNGEPPQFKACFSLSR
jgi:hypothetical protein